MTKFLEIYRGAVLYEMNSFKASEGQKMGVKIVAKAIHPNQKNFKVDFMKEASDQEKAIKKVKQSIDLYLKDHEIDKFVIDIL